MVIGTTLFKMDGTPYNSPEFGRGGLAARFSVNVTQIVDTPDFTITIEHRNSEDTSWTTAGTFSVIDAAGASSADITGLKEVVRFVYTFDAGDAPTAGVHFLMQAPSWRPY